MTSSFTLTPFSKKFRAPIKIGNEINCDRKGFILKLTSDDFFGEGELSPLPGLHKECLEDALCDLKKNLLHDNPLTFSSSKFCLESANLNISIKKRESYHGIDFFNLNNSIDKNILLIPTKNYNLTSIPLSKGATFKIKIGRIEPDIEINFINNLIKQHDNDLKLRLDGNRKLNRIQLAKILNGIDRKVIEYLEEPLESLREWDRIYKEFKTPLALDEELHRDNYTIPTGTTHFVIKPNLIGGINKSIELIEHAKKLNITSVISSSFESETGMKSLEKIATFADQNFKTAHGLNTLNFFV